MSSSASVMVEARVVLRKEKLAQATTPPLKLLRRTPSADLTLMLRHYAKVSPHLLGGIMLRVQIISRVVSMNLVIDLNGTTLMRRMKVLTVRGLGMMLR